MSSFTGRLALSVFRKSALPVTQEGMHIVLENMDLIAKEYHLCIFAVADEVAARKYATLLKEAEAAVARGEPSPETPIPGDTVEPDSVQRVIVGKAVLMKMVAQRRADEISPGYYNGWRDFLSADAVPTPLPAPESESEEDEEDLLQSLDGKAVADAVIKLDDRLVYVAAGHIIVSPDGTVSILDESDEQEYLVDAELAASYVVPSEPMVHVIDLGEFFQSHPECADVIKLLCTLPRSRASTSIAATPGTGMCAAEAAELSANRASANRRAIFDSGGRRGRSVGVLFRARTSRCGIY